MAFQEKESDFLSCQMSDNMLVFVRHRLEILQQFLSLSLVLFQLP
jgi:hypothetical protein